MKAIFCGNFDYDARQSDLERLFRRYGRVDRVDMKSGFAFVYMEDERDGEDAIRALDRIEFGRKGRRLRVEWTKQERGVRRPEISKRSSANSRPSKTLFVINFDPYSTRTRDLERHFDPYGKISNIRIRRNFAFVQYESQEDASKALDATNMSKIMDRVISVEYAIKDDDDKRNGYSPDRTRDRSPGRRRSPSPYRRERGSPDYGRGRSPSPYRRERASPDYGGRGQSPASHGRDRADPDYGRGRGRSTSPRREKPNPNHRRTPSPKARVRDEEYHRGPSQSPPRERNSPEDYRQSSPSPRRGGRVSPQDYNSGPSPNSKPERRDSAKYGGDESPVDERYRSPSPPARERSRS